MDAADNAVSTSNRRRITAILGLVAFALILGGVLAYAFGSGERGTDDAYVTGHIHTVSARVNGTVDRVLVDDNQFVRKGETLVQLDTRDFDVRVALEHSRVEQAQADQARSKAVIAQAQAAIVAAIADAKRASLDFARAQALTQASPRGLSRQEFDAADATRTSANARVSEAKAQLAVAEASLKGAAATESAGNANLRDATLQLRYTNIVAPTDGFVGKKAVEIGQRIAPGQALLAVVEKNGWVVANFRETQLRHIHIGDGVSMRFDAVPGLIANGHVQSFAPATGSQFALLAPDNATGNFTKVVQRVPVKIVFDDPNLYDKHLALGMSVMVKLDNRGETE